MSCFPFFFNDTATTEIYTLSLHDALPISAHERQTASSVDNGHGRLERRSIETTTRSEEHTSELQSRQYLVCRLLLEKKKRKKHEATEHRAHVRHGAAGAQDHILDTVCTCVCVCASSVIL